MTYSKLHTEGNLEALGALFIRYGLVVVLLWIGALKLTAYEAEGVFNHASHSPLLAWGYHLVDVRTFSVIHRHEVVPPVNGDHDQVARNESKPHMAMKCQMWA